MSDANLDDLSWLATLMDERDKAECDAKLADECRRDIMRIGMDTAVELGEAERKLRAVRALLAKLEDTNVTGLLRRSVVADLRAALEIGDQT